MENLLTLVINLDGSDARLADADVQLRQVGLDYERFSAFDARGTDPKSYPEYNHRDAVLYYGRGLNGGEIGCYFSHLKALKYFLESDAKFALIVEDDVEFDPDFRALFRGVMDVLDGPDAPEWDALNFGTPWREHMLTSIHEITLPGRSVTLCYAHLFPLNTHCILWSREGAAAFLDSFDSMWNPVDHAMRYRIVRRGRGLCMSEAIAHQSDAPSDIDRVEGKPAMRNENEGRWYWFHVSRIKTLEKIYAKRHRARIRKMLGIS